MSTEACKFCHGLRSARHITVTMLAEELGLTRGQYYYRLKKGENIDAGDLFQAVINLDAQVNKPPLYDEQIKAFRNGLERLRGVEAAH